MHSEPNQRTSEHRTNTVLDAEPCEPADHSVHRTRQNRRRSEESDTGEKLQKNKSGSQIQNKMHCNLQHARLSRARAAISAACSRARAAHGQSSTQAKHRPNTGRTQAEHIAEHKPCLPNRACRTALAEHRPNTSRTQALAEHEPRLPNRVCRTQAEHNAEHNTAFSEPSAEPWPNRVHRPRRCTLKTAYGKM